MANASASSAPVLLHEDARNALLHSIDENDETNDQVRALCFIFKDALKKPQDEMHDYLQEVLPVEVLFNKDCFTDLRIFSLVRDFLVALNIPIPEYRGKRISFKVAKTLYNDRIQSDEAVDCVNAWQQLRGVNAPPPQPTEAVINRDSRDIVRHAQESTPLCTNKAAAMSTFKEEDKFFSSVSGKVPLHRVKNKFIDVLRDQSIPRQDEVSLLQLSHRNSA